MTPLSESILKALAPTMGMTAAMLAGKLVKRRGTIVASLQHNQRAGLIVNVDGLWRLTAAGLKLTDGMTFTVEDRPTTKESP